MATESDPIADILEQLHEHGMRCYCEHQEKGLTRQEALTAIRQEVERICLEKQIEEVAMFFQRFEKHEDIGSTPSDLVFSEAFYEGDIEDVAAYFDERLTKLNERLAAALRGLEGK